MGNKRWDPITIEIIQNSIQAAADEMFVAMRRTAMSAIIYEVLDMGTGITDAAGNLAGSGAGIPSFVGMLDKAVRRIYTRFVGKDVIEPGDIFAVNDPYTGGVTHLNDVILAMPVFSRGEIVAWTANAAHWNDIGGMAAGSMTIDAVEIFQEGLRLPPVKLFSQGKPVASVMDILKANSRLPDYLVGDLWAGVAALRVGETRISSIIRKYGHDSFLHAVDRYMNYGEQVTLKALKELPQGTYHISEEQDNGQIYRVDVKIEKNRFTVDLCDNPDQSSGPYNLSREGSIIAAQMVLKSLTSPQTVCNSGTFRPLVVKTRKRSVFDPEPPAAMGFYYEVRIRLYDLIWRALAQHFPERLPAGHFASICGTMIGGIHPDTGRTYSVIEPEAGGWGGCALNDGNSAMFSAGHGETYNCPAEISEMRNGIAVERYALNDESGGEGQYRGGRGLCIEYRIRSDTTWLTASYTRSKIPPWPLNGGKEGSLNYIRILRANGTWEDHYAVSALPLKKGDIVRINTANGAGWGDPKLRDPQHVKEDIRNGWISQDVGNQFDGSGSGTA